MATAPTVPGHGQKAETRAQEADEHEDAVGERVSVAPLKESERPVIEAVEHMLKETRRSARPKLLGPGAASDREAIELPESLYGVLREVVHFLLQGKAVTVVPMHKEMTTQQAADFLNVSRPFFIKLLSQGAIPYTKVGTHRRIRFGELMEYKLRRDASRAESLDQLSQLSHELGLYESAQEFPTSRERRERSKPPRRARAHD